MVVCGTLFKSVSTVGFSGKADFLESLSFHSQMQGATNCGLVLGDCIVIEMISIQKYIVKLSRISFVELLKIPITIIWAMLKKLCLVFFRQKRLKNVKFDKSETYTMTALIKHLACMSRICDYSLFNRPDVAGAVLQTPL